MSKPFVFPVNMGHNKPTKYAIWWPFLVHGKSHVDPHRKYKTKEAALLALSDEKGVETLR